MTRHPYGPDELDRHDPALDDTATSLEEYASASGGEPPMDLAARIKTARITNYPAGTFDIFPTIADLLGLPDSVLLKPVDGASLKLLLAGGVHDTVLGLRRGHLALADRHHAGMLTCLTI